MTGERHSPAEQTPFVGFAWFVLAFTFGVIVFGAYVRITGSGAGCGQHWPTCHGEVVHLPESIETLIELTHRVTSGLSMVLAGVLLVWGLRRFPRPHPVRWGVALAMVFMIFEALIGAGLVLLELVGRNDSASRAIVMAIHLSNTCLLTGAMTIAAWSAGRPDSGPGDRPGLGLASLKARAPWSWLLLAGLAGVVLVSMAGAVTALGDTLYPVVEARELGERLAADQSSTAHFLQRMRVVHPVLAVVVSVFLLWLAISLPGAGRVAIGCAGLVVAQLCAGVLNIWLSAPGWMQLIHLGLATALWIALVVLLLELLGRAEPDRGDDHRST